ncbi:antirestriction protein [Curvibacter sp. RS43]|uniref:antirestriction protein n=1 Tax=Curvibacter microcysteis TaxID=3026419 RepID=UPI002362F879|nr:antirestriction protein [Curvibacter sp. RS43]MDD0812929.1 antirestriction protein [Curvibacter sp. RS43]
MASAPPTTSGTLTSQLVLPQHRSAFLSHFFGFPDAYHFESLLYNWGQTFIVEGNLEDWEVMRLSNQGLYMFPGQDPDRLVRLKMDGSGFNEVMPSDAAGITVTCVALSYLQQMGSEQASRHTRKLSEYFVRLPSACQISRALQGLF